MRSGMERPRRLQQKNISMEACNEDQGFASGFKHERAFFMKDILVRIGGEGGEGVISCGEMLTTAFARSSYEVYTFRTYPAEIKGGPAMFQVRASDELV